MAAEILLFAGGKELARLGFSRPRWKKKIVLGRHASSVARSLVLFHLLKCIRKMMC